MLVVRDMGSIVKLDYCKIKQLSLVSYSTFFDMFLDFKFVLYVGRLF